MATKPDKTHVWEKLDAPPYVVEVSAIGPDGMVRGGTQRWTADTLPELAHSLAKAYSNLFAHLKIMKDERVKLYADLQRLQRKPKSSGLSTR